jgi:tetratricopeptide (TPR) repeat protein
VIASRWMVAVAVVGLAGLTACNGRDDDADRVRLNGADPAMEEARAGWSAEYGGLIDSGNDAYRAGRYDDAADTFRRATEAEPQIAAGWFGLHMSELARGNQEAAAEALQQAEALTPGLGGGHPMGPEDMPHPPMDLPPGHPTMPGQSPETP